MFAIYSILSSWKDLYKNVCEILYELDPIKFKQIMIDHKFDYKHQMIKDAITVDNMLIYSNLNIEAFLARLRVLFEEIGLDLDELSFEIE